MCGGRFRDAASDVVELVLRLQPLHFEAWKLLFKFAPDAETHAALRNEYADVFGIPRGR